MNAVRRWWGVAPAALLLLLVWPERAFVSIWDGNVYLQCVVDAAAHGLNVHSLRCGGHQSQLYMGLLALTQLPRPGNVEAIAAANTALALGALAGFAAVFRKLLPGDQWWPERALLVTLIAVHPLISATLIQVNSDFGVYAFFAMTLACLVWQRYWLAAAAGLMLCFSKETGALVYCAALALHLAVRMRDGTGRATERVSQLARNAAPAVLPLAAFACFLAWWAITQRSYAVWNQGIHVHPFAGIHWFNFDDVIFRSYAAIIFVLGFAWIPTAVIAADLVVGGLRAVRHLGPRSVRGADASTAGYLIALTALLVYLLTLYRTWSFPRYFVVLAPLLLIAGFLSLLRLGAEPRTARWSLAAMTAVFLASSHASWDPVSRRLFGTLSLGESSAYDVSSVARDFRVRDADHLCYNLQFTGFHWALNALFAALRPVDATAIVFPRFNRWGLWSPLDARTFERVAFLTGTVTPRYMDEATVAALRDHGPGELWLVEQPNDGDTLAVQKLHRDYADADSARYTAAGLSVTARHLVRRNAPVLASGAHR